MKIITKDIPKGIRYLSHWKEFNSLPVGQHYILAKEICGCGATEAYIGSQESIIIAMPRKHLLYNKYSKHIGENVFLYRFLDREQYFSDKTPTVAELEEFDSRFVDYIRCGGTKILATYDSLYKLTVLMQQEGVDLNTFRVVVDEFQQIIGDAPFKPEIEHQFYMALKKFKTVVYLSGTPFLQSYLEMTPQFRDLTMIRLKWPESAIKIADVHLIKLTKSITKKCCEIIRQYKSGEAPSLVIDGELKMSKEAVFFLNDVKSIITVIKKAGLAPEEVNILCAPRKENYKRISELNKDKADTDPKFERGEIPGFGDTHKMFPFCTSTVYIGADFNSESAYSYIFANPNVESLTIDVGTDIQQIVGRQRRDDNPFQMKADFYYYLKKPLVTEEEIIKIIESKRERTKEHLDNFYAAKHKDAQLKSMEALIKAGHIDQYCCISKDDKGNTTVVENHLITIAEKRAWDIANTIYSGDLSLIKALKKSVNIIRDVDSTDPDVKKLFDEWAKDGKFERQAMMYCELREQMPDMLAKCFFIPTSFHNYYDALGRKGMEDLKWRQDYIRRALAPTPDNQIPHEKIVEHLTAKLVEGKEYSKEDIKQILIEIYQKLGVKGNPSASDIGRYFTIKPSSIRINKKKVATIKIISHWQKRITLFKSITSVMKPIQEDDADSVLSIIEKGDAFNLKRRITNLRTEAESSLFAEKKSHLPVATWNGVFNYRDSSGCQIYSSLTALDFDHIEDLPAIETWLKGFPCVYAYFRTPSGNGVKAIILHDNRLKENHADLYDQLLRHFKCGVQDTSTSDLGRGNYLSHDADLWRNPNPVPYHYEPSPIPLKPVEKTHTVVKSTSGEDILQEDDSLTNQFLRKLERMILTDESIINILRKQWNQTTITRGRNNTALSYAGVLCKAGVEQTAAQTFIEELIPTLPKEELTRAVKYAYSHNIFGSNRSRYIKYKGH